MRFEELNKVEARNLLAPVYDIASDAMTLGLHRIARRAFCDFASRRIPKRGRVLDISTGTGALVFSLVKKRPDIAVTGIDISPGMLDVARGKLASSPELAIHQCQISFELASPENLPVAPHSVDVVTASWAFRGMESRYASLKECLRVLKPGGSLLILETKRKDRKLQEDIKQVRAKLNPIFQDMKEYFVTQCLKESVSEKKFHPRKILDLSAVKRIPAKLAQEIRAHKPLQIAASTQHGRFPEGHRFLAELYEAGFVKPRSQKIRGGFATIYLAQAP